MSHEHSIGSNVKEQALVKALILTSVVFVAEGLGAFITQSLALLSDAAHMLTDVTALFIALMAIRIGKRPADDARSFGYYRFEILAAAFNTLMLFFVAFYILVEAYKRLGQPASIHSVGMLTIATVGFIANFIAMRFLTKSKERSLNIKGAYLEVWSDMLGSLGVIIGAIIIKFFGWKWVDSVVAIAIALWVLPRGWTLLKESIHVLLEGTPRGVNLKEITQTLLKIEGVKDIHELHIWAITNDKICLTAHAVLDEKFDCDYVLAQMRERLADKFNIIHTTLQHERVKCLNEQMACHFDNSESKLTK